MTKLLWEWHCVWYDQYGDIIDRDYADIGGDIKRFAHNQVTDYKEAKCMEFGLTLHWNGDGDWTDIEQERADIDEQLNFDLAELSKAIQKYIMEEFEEHKDKLKPQGSCPWHMEEA